MANKEGTRWFARLMKAVGIMSLCLLSALIGGSFPRLIGATDYTLTYADFVSIMLTAVSVLVTVLAIFLAVAGFVGWTTIEQKVHAKTEDVLARGLAKGGRLERLVMEMLEKKSEQMIYRGVEPLDEEAARETNPIDFRPHGEA